MYQVYRSMGCLSSVRVALRISTYRRASDERALWAIVYNRTMKCSRCGDQAEELWTDICQECIKDIQR